MRMMAWIQGIYFFITGIWPLIDIRSFMAVTGPKKDIWLVRTVGGLISVIALTICLAAWQGEVASDVVFLAMASSAALLVVDVVYPAMGVISKIYLCDAVVEVALLICWSSAVWRRFY